LLPARALPSPRIHWRNRRRVRRRTSGRSFVYNPRLPGQYYDAETGLNYNSFRDYDSATGRYVESDPIGLDGGSYSTYSYSRLNPMMFRDPTGLVPNPAEATCIEPAQPICWAGVIADIATWALGGAAGAAALATPGDTPAITNPMQAANGGSASRPAPYSHAEEDESLYFVPDPFGGDEACRRLANAIKVLRGQISWRGTDLNPDSASYLGHVKRIAALRAALAKLEEAHRNICGKDCPN
jgi:RHS repeat-associated protein